MDQFLEKLDRHCNWIAAAFLLVLGAFLAALIMSADAGAIAQALGNIIGAAIGAAGAAAAVVWQLNRQARLRTDQVSELRETALRGVTRDCARWIYELGRTAEFIVNGQASRAIEEAFRNLPDPREAFEADQRLEEQLRIEAPRDIAALDDLRIIVVEAWNLVRNLHGSLSTSEADVDNFAAATAACCRTIVAFLRHSHIEGHQAGVIISEANLIIEKLNSVGLPKGGLGWLFIAPPRPLA